MTLSLPSARSLSAIGWRTPAVIVLCGCVCAVISFGPRATLGFFLTPQSLANGWGRDVFGLAIAIQNIMWGLGQPFAGMLADRFGVVRVLWVGAIVYAIGLAMMAYATTPLMLNLSAGVFIGFGLAGCAFSVVLSAFGKLLPESMRSLAFGAGAAAGSFGQFLYSPLAVSLVDSIGWQQTLLTFAVMMLLILPFSLPLATAGKAAAPDAQSQSLRAALSEALLHRSYVLLVLGFFTCGFQLSFITIHLPPYLVDKGLTTQVGGWTIAVIGLFNIFGSLTSGWLGNRMPKRYILSIIYFGRAHGDPRLHPAAGHAVDLDRVRRRHGLPVAFDGGADAGAHRAHVRHPLARDAGRRRVLQPSGRRLPRCLAGRGRVRAHRLLRCGMVAFDPVRLAVGRHQSADRGEAGRAACRRRVAGMSGAT